MTAPPSSSDPTAGPHPSVDELADLSEDLLAPAEAEALREHLAGCADCRETVDALTEVRALLGAAEAPAVPADVAARIDAALAAAAGPPAAATPATAPAAATPTTASTTATPTVPAARPAPTAPPKAPPARPTAGTGPGRSRRGRRRALLLGSAAALLVLGLGGAFLSLSSSGQQDLSATADAAARPAVGTAAPESSTAGAKTDRATGGTVYQDDQLAAQVGQLLTAAGTARPVKPSAGPGSGPAATDPSEPSGATAVPPADGGQGLVGGNRSTPACPPPSTAALLATDRGSYAGAAADLLVYALPGRPELLDVYLRAPDCGPVLRHLTVPAP
ncbi:zf-HC2 domain-containing protein [Kitasatospora purpeofusca]|uniref:Zf-HC2 domain-containing protein n=1 Tax=Kitasatospora purpeofusca TaxID=67352 RepID=A0ABZ1U1J1_9ACTN|nr:zf-HC2 domain-containing protein [Kitasatospora purpeofusca]